MDILFLAFLFAVSKLFLLCKVFGAARVVRFQIPLDIFFTVGVPLFVGTSTITGTILAILSGIIFSILLFILSLFVKPSPKLKINGREII